jgi:hypothetical protein
MRRGFPALAMVMLLGLSACAGFRPRMEAEVSLPGGPADMMGILPPESTVFAAMDVGSFETLLTGFFDAGRSRKLLARTERLYAGITVSAAEAPAFSLIGLGRYPAGRMKLPLCLSRRWRRVEKAYWVRKGETLEIALPRRDMFLAANGSMASLLARYDRQAVIPLPADVRGRMDASELLLFFPSLAAVVGELETLPVESAWLEAARAGEDYRVSAVLVLAEGVDWERSAAMEALVRLGLIMWLRRENRADLAGRLKAMQIRAVNGRVHLEGILLSGAEIEEILSGFIPAEEGQI